MQSTIGELVVLGMLAERPRHGYDIEQVIEQRGVRQWTEIGFSSIYYLLNKLERRGLATSDDGVRSAKARRLFTITEQGRRTAAADVYGLLSDARTPPQSFLAGLANASLLSKREVDEALGARFAALTARIESVGAAQDAQEPLSRAARDTFSYSLSRLRAERSWLAERNEGSDD